MYGHCLPISNVSPIPVMQASMGAQGLFCVQLHQQPLVHGFAILAQSPDRSSASKHCNCPSRSALVLDVHTDGGWSQEPWLSRRPLIARRSKQGQQADRRLVRAKCGLAGAAFLRTHANARSAGHWRACGTCYRTVWHQPRLGICPPVHAFVTAASPARSPGLPLDPGNSNPMISKACHSRKACIRVVAPL